MKKFIPIICALIIAAGCAAPQTDPPGDNSLLVWDSMKSGEIIELANECGIGRVYLATSGLSAVPTAEDLKIHEETVVELRKENLEIFYLFGDPSFGTNAEGTEICAAIDAVAKSEVGFDGVVLDVEPYTLTDWNIENDENKETWLSAMRSGKAKAEEYDLEYIVCLPYWLEGEFLEDIVSVADGIEVMAFHRGTEIDDLADEYRLAHDKRIAYVAEVNQFESWSELEESWKTIEEAYPGMKLTFQDSASLAALISD